MHKLTFSVIMLIILMATGCSKDDSFVNLKSTLKIENTIIGTIEGKPMYINLSLSDALSQDLALEASISNQNIVSQLDDSDYSKTFEYSTDGRSWTKSDNNRVIFRKGTATLKVRIATLDDKQPEVREEFNFSLKPVDAGKFTLINELSPVKAYVLDNDVTSRPQEEGVIMELSIDAASNSYKVEALAERANSKLEKEVIDGKYKKPVEDALKAFRLLPQNVKVVRFQIIANPRSGLGGYVFNSSQSGGDEWIMGMNLGFAYFDPNTRKPIDYNANGEYGNIFTHELGHILTLNYSKEITKIEEGGSCSNYKNREGCSKADSHVNLFNKGFYAKTISNEPTHVTRYAKTNLEEDIAETFAHYVIQETIKQSTSSSSGALQKLNFIKGRNDLVALKSKIRTIYKLGYINPQKDILARQVDKNGKSISCLNHKELLKALRTQ